MASTDKPDASACALPSEVGVKVDATKQYVHDEKN